MASTTARTLAISKWIIFSMVLSTILVASSDQAPLKKDEVWKCVRWQWAGAPGQSQVNCVEWAKRDCSTRLYPDICKLSG